MNDRIKEAFDSLLVEMESPPTWDDLITVPVTPQRRQFRGPVVALAAAGATLLLVGAVALFVSQPDPAPPVQGPPGEWTEVATIPMSINSGAIVEAVDDGIVVLQTDSSTLVGFDGSVTSGEVAPVVIQPGCCGSALGIPVGDRLILFDAYQVATWVLDPGTMTWGQIGDRPSTGDVLGSALIGTDLYVVTSAPRSGGGASSVDILSLEFGTWRSVDPAPSGISVGGVTTDGESLIVAGTRQDGNNNVLGDSRNPIAFELDAASVWHTLPQIPIDGQSSTVVWVDGAGVMAWNYDQEAALLDSAGAWGAIDDVPMEFSECSPQSMEVEGGVVGACGGLAYFNGESRTWAPLKMTVPAWYVSAGGALYEVAAGSSDVTVSRLPFASPPVVPDATTTSSPATTGSFAASVTVDHLGWEVVSLPDGVSAANGIMIWSGEELLFWGGEDEMSVGQPEGEPGMAYDPDSRTWRFLPPSPKGVTYGSAAVWAGSEMIVCCGALTADETVAYDPATDTWRVLADTPTRGEYAESVWTGEEMVVVGPSGVASYDPATDSWVEFPEPSTPLERINELALMGSELIVWPNIYGRTTGPGMALDLKNGEWRLLPEPPTSTWPAMLDIETTGTELLIWGGLPSASGGSERAVGSWFDGALRTWRALPGVLPEPDGCECNLGSQTLLWTGQELLVWPGFFSTGLDPSQPMLLSFDPETAQWTLVDASPAQWGGQTLMAGDRVVVRTGPISGADRIVISPTGWRSDGQPMDPLG